MRLARILGAIGRGLISAGVIVLLFVAYQLWGTGLQHSAAQNGLNDDFIESTGIDASSDVAELAELVAASQDDIADGVIIASDPEAVLVDEDAAGDTGDEAADPTDPDVPTPDAAQLFDANFDAAARQEILAKLYPEPGEAFARVVIPDINVDQISVEGVSVEDLRKGPGHYRTTPNPGQAGNAAIAGHRTTYGAPFHRVDELDPGDLIFVTTAQGTFQYEVLGFDDQGNEVDEDNPVAGGGLGYFIVNPSQTEVLDQGDRNLLTLTACHPKYSARQRIIVQAKLIGEPAPTIPRDEAVEIGAISLDSGSADERAAEAEPVDAEVPEGEDQIMSDAVAADDDPSVDANGDPIADSDELGDQQGSSDADDEDAGGDSADDAAAVADTSSDSTDTASTADLFQEVEVDTSTEADLTSAEGPLGDPNDFGEGLNGDPTKVRPAILWGISGLFIWLAAWFVGKQFDRKWTLYAFGLVPFGFVLWSTFVNVDQALPSY